MNTLQLDLEPQLSKVLERSVADAKQLLEKGLDEDSFFLCMGEDTEEDLLQFSPLN